MEVYKIKDRRPGDGQECWVCRFVGGRHDHPTMQVYNERHDVWDDADGDDYDFDITGEDMWMPLPQASEMAEAYITPKAEYTPPEIEVMEYKVEHGYAQSSISGDDDDFVIDTVPDDPHDPHDPHRPHDPHDPHHPWTYPWY